MTYPNGSPSALLYLGERPQDVQAFVLPRSVEASLLACVRWPIPRARASGHGGTEFTGAVGDR